jgi:hypothetical protein
MSPRGLLSTGSASLALGYLTSGISTKQSGSGCCQSSIAIGDSFGFFRSQSQHFFTHSIGTQSRRPFRPGHFCSLAVIGRLIHFFAPVFHFMLPPRHVLKNEAEHLSSQLLLLNLLYPTNLSRVFFLLFYYLVSRRRGAALSRRSLGDRGTPSQWPSVHIPKLAQRRLVASKNLRTDSDTSSYST